jgi:hypothetical protein
MTLMIDADAEKDDQRSDFERLALEDGDPDESRLRMFYFCKKTHKRFTLVNIGCYLEDLDDEWYRYAQNFGENPGMYLQLSTASNH